jgi:two-component system, LuxR family, sensor kinase FixL
MAISKLELSAAELRRKAEESLARRPASLRADEPDAQRLLHELQVHQIELEMQNESLRQMQAEAQEAIQRMALAQRAAQVGFWDFDVRSGRVYWSPEVEAMYGLPPGAFDGLQATWLSLVHPDDRERVKQEVMLLGQQPEPFEIAFRILSADGQIRWLASRGQSVFDAAGQLLRIIGMNADVTEGKEIELALQESEQRYRSLVESAPDAIFVTIDHRIVMVNPACCLLFGARRETDLLGRDMWSLIHPDSHATVRQRAERALIHGLTNPSQEVMTVRLDGTALAVDAVSVPFSYDGRRAIHIMMRDATPRKQAEALMRQHREDMEKSLALLVAQQTVAGIAHELNQPLNAISTLGEAASRQLRRMDGIPPRLVETVAGMVDGAQRAGQLLLELVHFLEQPDMSRQSLDLQSLIRETIEQSIAGRRFPGRLDVRSPPVWPAVIGNAAQIEKVLLNILRNAIEACSGGRKAEIIIDVAVVEAGARICISDNGPGISPEFLPKLFHPFASSKPGGIGMGLAISRALVKAQGGHLWHEPASPDGPGGACFCFTLPQFIDHPA